MQSYKVILNGIRAALDGLTGKIKRLREDFTSLAWVPIMETKVKELWSGELTKMYNVVERGFPTLVAGKEYTVTIGEEQYSVTAVAKKIDEANGICIGNFSYLDEGEDTGEPFIVFNTQGAGLIKIEDEVVGQTMTISRLTEVAGSELEYLKDYIDRKDAESGVVEIQFSMMDYNADISCNLTPAQILALTPEELGRASVSFNFAGLVSFIPAGCLKVKAMEIAFFFLEHGILEDVPDGWAKIWAIGASEDGFALARYASLPAKGSMNQAFVEMNYFGVLGKFGKTYDTSNMRFGETDNYYTVPDLKAKLDTAVLNGATEMSLTSPSGKVFTITVADDGTLTATEAST